VVQVGEGVVGTPNGVIEPLMQIGKARSDFLEVLKHRIDHFEGLINLFTDFRTGQDNFAANEDQENDLGLDHSIDQTREQLRFVRTEVVMARCKTLQADRELDVARANDVLDLEVRELCVEAELLDDARILS
jgi:hypothetical protein